MAEPKWLLDELAMKVRERRLKDDSWVSGLNIWVDDGTSFLEAKFLFHTYRICMYVCTYVSFFKI